MSYDTYAERITALETRRDAIIANLAAGTNIPPSDIAYMQDPDGGQVSFRDVTDPYEELERLDALIARYQDLADAADAGITGVSPIVLIRRRS